MDNVELAKSFAAKWHEGQKYGTRDYFFHLWEVADTIYNWHDHNLETLVCVAYLHDILEDTECTFREILEVFGGEIAFAVLALTKIKGGDYLTYIYGVKQNEVALKIKIADTFCNLNHSIAEGNKHRIAKYTRQLQLLTEDTLQNVK